jgi:uncharacterized protein (TIGR03437 family)
MRLSCLLVLTLLGPTTSQIYAQTPAPTNSLSGSVTDGSGEPLIGATILIEDTNSSSVFGSTTDENGAYRVPDLPGGTYEVTVSYTGYEDFETTVFHSAKSTVKQFLLTPETDDRTPTIFAASNAASSRPGYLSESSVPPGGMVTVYLRNGGPADLAVAQDVTLQPILGGASAYIEIDGLRYGLSMVYAFETQIAAVVGASTPLGKGNLFVEYNGGRSGPFPINIVESQLGLFSRSQDGQGQGLGTDVNYALYTPDHPMKIGDTAILWGADGSPFDTSPGVADLRNSLDVDIFFGGFQIPDESVRYYGSAGGNTGLTQIIFDVVPGVPLGCNVSVQVRVQGSGSPNPAWSNVVGFPVTAGESYCGDRHGLSSLEVERILSGAPYRKFVTSLTENTSFNGDRFFAGGFSTLRGFEFTKRSLNPPAAKNTCAYRWGPDGIRIAAPRRLGLTGAFSLNLWDTPIQLDENSAIIPFYQDVEFPDPTPDGSYNFFTSSGFAVEGEPTSLNGAGVYTRSAGRLKDLIDVGLSNRYREEGFVSATDVIDALIENKNSEELDRVVVNYKLSVSNGAFGHHDVDCNFFGGANDLDASRALFATQQQNIFPLLPETAEFASVQVTISNLDRNLTQQGSGPSSVTEEVFEASSNFTISPDAYERQFKRPLGF